MKNKLFIGSLPWAVTSEDLKELFASYGDVTDAHVATDKFSGRSRGFGFVEFATDEAAAAALNAMNGADVQGREITVDFARPKGE